MGWREVVLFLEVTNVLSTLAMGSGNKTCPLFRGCVHY